MAAMRSSSDLAPHTKAYATGRFAETLFRALSARQARRWNFVSFRGAGGGESRGIVDVVAIRRDMSPPSRPPLRSGDLFDIILVQVKGGAAPRPTADDIARLKSVAKHYRAKSVVLYAWRNGVSSQFFKLHRGDWQVTTAAEVFG
jgi:hypothetical protein